MKHLVVLSLCLVVLIKCTEDPDILSANDELNYRTIAYNSLQKEEKESITKDWEKAEVLKGIYKKNDNAHIIVLDSESSLHFFLKDSSATLTPGQQLVSVTFRTTDEALVGPINVIVNPKSRKAIGGLLRH